MPSSVSVFNFMSSLFVSALTAASYFNVQVLSLRGMNA
jgi:hypothetical protein